MQATLLPIQSQEDLNRLRSQLKPVSRHLTLVPSVFLDASLLNNPRALDSAEPFSVVTDLSTDIQNRLSSMLSPEEKDQVEQTMMNPNATDEEKENVLTVIQSNHSDVQDSYWTQWWNKMTYDKDRAASDSGYIAPVFADAWEAAGEGMSLLGEYIDHANPEELEIGDVLVVVGGVIKTIAETAHDLETGKITWQDVKQMTLAKLDQSGNTGDGQSWTDWEHQTANDFQATDSKAYYRVGGDIIEGIGKGTHAAGSFITTFAPNDPLGDALMKAGSGIDYAGEELYAYGSGEKSGSQVIQDIGSSIYHYVTDRSFSDQFKSTFGF